MAHGQTVYRGDKVSLQGGMRADDWRDAGIARHLAERDTNGRPQWKKQKGSLARTRTLVDGTVMSVCGEMAWVPGLRLTQAR